MTKVFNGLSYQDERLFEPHSMFAKNYQIGKAGGTIKKVNSSPKFELNIMADGDENYQQSAQAPSTFMIKAQEKAKERKA